MSNKRHQLRPERIKRNVLRRFSVVVRLKGCANRVGRVEEFPIDLEALGLCVDSRLGFNGKDVRFPLDYKIHFGNVSFQKGTKSVY